MKLHDVKQGTPEWRALRLGVITASDAEKLVTPKTLKPSASQDAYAMELVCEILLGAPPDDSTDKWRERGLALEAEARAWFSFVHRPLTEVGFISLDDKPVGCSPDGIVPGEFGWECKCPSAKVHVGYLLKPERLVADYRLQVQMGLYVTRWPLWKLQSMCPGLPPVLVDIRPEPDVFDAFATAIPPVVAAVAEGVARIRALATA